MVMVVVVVVVVVRDGGEVKLVSLSSVSMVDGFKIDFGAVIS